MKQKGELFFPPGLREEIWSCEGGRHLAKSLEESEPAFQVVTNTWEVICAARRASLLLVGRSGLGGGVREGSRRIMS